MVLNLSGEIGLTKNRLTTLRTEILQGNRDGKPCVRWMRPSASWTCWWATCRTR
jgi:hypothetical protein